MSRCARTQVIGEERGSALVISVMVSTLLAGLALSLVVLYLTESRTSIAATKREQGDARVESTIDMARWLLTQPVSSGGWGPGFTTASRAESVDTAISRGRYVSVDSGVVVIQSTEIPMRRRITAIERVELGAIDGWRMQQALVDLHGTAPASIPTLVAGVDYPATMTIERWEISGASSGDSAAPAVWSGHGGEVSVDASRLIGDVLAHGPIFAGATGVTVDAGGMISFAGITSSGVIVGATADVYSSGIHDGRFPEYDAIGFRSMLAVLLATATEGGAGADSGTASGVVATVVPEGATQDIDFDVCTKPLPGSGRHALHYSARPTSCLGGGVPVMDRWSEPVSDGVIRFGGAVRVSGGLPPGVTLVATGGTVLAGVTEDAGFGYASDTGCGGIGPDSSRMLPAIVSRSLRSDAAVPPRSICADLIAAGDVSLGGSISMDVTGYILAGGSALMSDGTLDALETPPAGRPPSVLRSRYSAWSTRETASGIPVSAVSPISTSTRSRIVALYPLYPSSALRRGLIR